MKKSGRAEDHSLKRLQIELCSKEEIEENNLYLAGSLAYFFGVVYATLLGEVETYFGIILILTAIMMVWALRDMRKAVVRKYEQRIEELLKHNED